MSKVMTVVGSVSASEIDLTLMHEHIFINKCASIAGRASSTTQRLQL
jgi:predicted metal-dependent phosphotriesterase family hydrolase